MRYVIVYLLTGDIRRYHQKLVRTVGPKFGENYLIEHPLPSHVTLKAPFELRNVRVLEKLIYRFVKEHRTYPIKIKGFGNFRRFVSFFKFNFSFGAKKVRKELLKELIKIRGIQLHEFDKKYKPHATICYGNTSEKFDEIWRYLKSLDKPRFNLKLDNITILKKMRGKWKIHKIYRLE